MAHCSFALHPGFLHDPPRGDVVYVRRCPNSFNGQVLEPKFDNAAKSFRRVSVTPQVMVEGISDIRLPMLRFANSDSDSPDKFGRVADLNGEMPIVLRIGLASSHDPRDELGRAFQGLRRQRQETDELFAG